MFLEARATERDDSVIPVSDAGLTTLSQKKKRHT